MSCVALSVDLLWVFSVSHDDLLKMYSMEEMRVTRSIQVLAHTLFVRKKNRSVFQIRAV